ncbi:hypothetical protein L6R52_31065 [Myxococcota bacterium]|nr:hypothetical protein [Myxococcota bacterium]
MQALALLVLPALLTVGAPPAPPPKLTLHELSVGTTEGTLKRVRFATPRGWAADVDREAANIRLVGPEGEGEILVVVATHPSQLGEHLTRLKESHPSAAPSPPMAVTVRGIDPERGERATRFQITGREVGEMVMIERGGVIVLFASIVAPDAWDALAPALKRCYPTVEVVDVEPARDRAPGGGR